MEMMTETCPSLPWRTRLSVFVASVTTNLVCRRDGSVNRRLFSLFEPRAPANPIPVDGVSSSDHTVDPVRGLWVRIFSPQGRLPVIVYFHGGGFIVGSPATHPFDALCRRIARAVPAVVVSVNYRLAPEHRYPAAYDDCFDALRWVDGAAGVLPGASGVFLAGDSAGGNIAHHVAKRVAAAAAGSFERVTVSGVALLQPFFGGEARTESEVRFGRVLPLTMELSDWMWRSFLPEGADRDHDAANVFGSGSGVELSGFPPTAVFVGGCDPLRDRQMGYVTALTGAGVKVGVVEYPGAIHGFYAYPQLPQARQVILALGDFVRAHQGSSGHGLAAT